MTQKTLYLLQGSYAALEQHIQTLTQVLTTEDSVVLMGDAVLKHQHKVLLQHAHCYVLEQDVALLGDLAHQLTTLNYAQFADLVLVHSRHISLK
jgi:sulfur relay protein TusB/DsrH